MNKEIELKMQKTIESLEAKLVNIRAGRANPAMLNGITVSYYGVDTPLNALANITVPKGCCYTLSVENTSDAAIEVQNANLTINRTA